jgi:hypothetical protein
MKEETQKILLSPYFILGLLLLLLNDFFLKQQFHNFLTGKISDFAGLFVFPLFFTAFFPKRKTVIYISTAILFIFWKSPPSQSLIDFWNSLDIFKISRVVDYTDLLALLVLPLSYFYFKTEVFKSKTVSRKFTNRIFASFVVLLSVFAFTATTLVRDRGISFDREYKLRLNNAQIESILSQNLKIQNLKLRATDSGNTWVDFKLKQKFCDSEFPEFHFLVEKNDVSIIRSAYVNFECALYETELNTENLQSQQKRELNDIFEREVIEKLRQNSSQ